ncbi:hypothetical protein Tsubulata_012857 [Turnera subulata]|uniref:Uncharacterized protein n=1 Tax=Turnera subulata TaxID=218843 RepID=A0A9Q0GJI6_9ROSI|nr:hypothetical protein Tsubulata_012857 [Turnera subulata]
MEAPSSPSSPFKSSSLRASSYTTPKPSPPSLIVSVIRTTSISLAVAAALFLTRLHTRLAIAAPVAAEESSSATPSPSATTTEKENYVSLGEQERALEQQLARNPGDTEALRSLMEVRIKSRKLLEAVEVVDRLMELEPDDGEWPLLKYQIYMFSGDYESARKGFEEVLAREPLRVEAYHGLAMANAESGNSLDDVVKRIDLAMDTCRKEKKKTELRDFKLLFAQIRVMEENFGEALKVYEELVKEEPRDFRPYLCQGIIYALLKKKDAAEKKFDQFKKLVPENHPYKDYLMENMLATKLFSEKLQREGA